MNWGWQLPLLHSVGSDAIHEAAGYGALALAESWAWDPQQIPGSRDRLLASIVACCNRREAAQKAPSCYCPRCKAGAPRWSC